MHISIMCSVIRVYRTYFQTVVMHAAVCILVYRIYDAACTLVCGVHVKVRLSMVMTMLLSLCSSVYASARVCAQL
jgi:hypothetical protein